jgi:transcriptional regulator with GAF, ATPase, and Fis domain
LPTRRKAPSIGTRHAMVTVTRELAERIASMAELLLSDDASDAPLHQLAELSLELIPGSTAAGVVVAGESSWATAASDATVGELHHLQLAAGDGPVAESLRYGEARRIDDSAGEDRWPALCAAMASAELRSCLVLPLRTDREPGGALAIYGREPGCFAGSGHDVALLFAAQGGVAMRNAALYENCQRLVQNLHIALESRAVIEQAKGILVAEHGCSPDVAFKRLSALSQNTNKKLKDIAADLVAGRIQRQQFAGDD